MNPEPGGNIFDVQFEKSDCRDAILPGICYPKDRDKLSRWLSDRFNSASSLPTGSPVPIKALYAPHIDPRVDQGVYAQSFPLLRSLRPKRVVVLATSHYSGFEPNLYSHTPFIGSRKSFILPNGTVETDSHAMDLLAEGGKTIGYTERDRAHRPEHSIELHLLFARHIWNHPFNIVPVLVGTFHELHYMRSGDLSKQIDKFSKLLRRLDDDDTFFLISGDLSHVGIKFGDSESASSMRPDVEKHDHRFLKLAAENRSEELLEHTGTSFDPYRVCGFPPLYTWLKAFPERTGSEVAYHWWDESEMRSAVSFGTISY